MKKIMFILLCPLLLPFSSPKKDPQLAAQYLQDYNAGVAAQKDYDYQAAIQYYRKALEQKTDFADAWNNLGYCYRMVAKSYLAQSGDAYDKALKYAPNHEGALEYQGEYFVLMGQLNRAYGNYQVLTQMHSGETKALKAKLDKVLKEAQEVLKSYSP